MGSRLPSPVLLQHLNHKIISFPSRNRDFASIRHNNGSFLEVSFDALGIDKVRLMGGEKAVACQHIAEDADVIATYQTAAIGKVDSGVFLPTLAADNITYSNEFVGIGAGNADLGFLPSEVANIMPQYLVKLDFFPIGDSLLTSLDGFDKGIRGYGFEQVVYGTDL